MSLKPVGLGAALTTVPDTVVYTAPQVGTSTIVGLHLTSLVDAPATAQVTVKVGQRNTYIYKKTKVTDTLSLQPKLVLMPGETLMAWAEVENTANINLFLLERA